MTASVATYWCREAWLGGAVAARDVQIDVVDGRIDRVVTGVATPPSGARRRDGLTLPGFANTHSHSFHRALRGRSGGAAGSFWTWREGMYELAASLDPNRFGRLARAVFAEMALAGFTCVGEFHYLHHDRDGTPYANPNVMGDALTEAAADAGLRITLLDTCYLHGGIGVDLDATQRRFDDGSVEAWIDRVGRLATGGHVRLGAAVHSVRACTPSEIAEVAAWASQAGTDGAPLHAHVSEQPA